MLETVFNVLRMLVVGLMPKRNANPEERHRWSVRVGFVLFWTACGLVAVTALEWGSLAWLVGNAGFARADQLAALAQAQKADIATLVAQRTADKEQDKHDRISTLDSRIVDLRIRHCQAPTPEGRQLYWTKIAQRMDEYTQLTQRNYALPDCKDL